MDEGMKRWLDEASKASEDLERQVSEEERDLMEEVPKSEEEKGLEKLQGFLDSVDPKNATEMSEAGESLSEARESLVTKEFRRMAALRDDWPLGRRHRMRRAPPATKRQREKIAKQMDEWLMEAQKESSDVDEEYTSADRELMSQMDNFTKEEERSIIPEADRELAILQGIWERYELDNENATAMDLLDKLYPDEHAVEAWYEDALERLHPKNATQSKEVEELREQVESLKAELEKVASQAKKDAAAGAPAKPVGKAWGKALRQRAAEVTAGILRAQKAKEQVKGTSAKGKQ